MTRNEQIAIADTKLYLSVRIAQSMHAIPIEAVEEVLPMLPVEPVSQLPVYMRGVVFVRGHLIPVLDGAERLGLPGRLENDDRHLICLRVHGRLVGVEVDEAVDLIRLSLDAQLTTEELGGSRRFLAAVVESQGKIIRILAPEKLLFADEISTLEEVHHQLGEA